MPFKSQAQRKKFFAVLPSLADKWQDHTGKAKLPERVSTKKSSKIKSKRLEKSKYYHK